MKTQQFDWEKILGFQTFSQEPQLVREGCPFIGEDDWDTDLWKTNTCVWNDIRYINMYENQTCKYAEVLDSNSLIWGENRDKYEDKRRQTGKCKMWKSIK